MCKCSQINKQMAKSDSSTVVAQSGAVGTKKICKMEQQQKQHPSSRPSRLEKQEEFEEEEEIIYMPSPVTIQIEDRGGGPEDDETAEGGLESECRGMNGNKVDYGETGEREKNGTAITTLSTSDELTDSKYDRSKVPSQRVKVLVRSQAVHDDASPPPDLETVISNNNMLSVTNAPAFATQTQSKSSNKNRLGRQGSSQGSQGSTESSSGLSRDSSTETYTDSTGVDLQQFIIDTLHKNPKDRMMLLKIEQELITLVKDTKRHTLKFGQMSSYNRMLVHRVAAFFGLDHFVDGSGTSVIVNKTKNTRIPDSRFQDHFRDELLPEEPKKSILKRDSISFEEGKEKSPERQSSTDSRRSKSFEEREEEYEKARARIFNKDEGLGESPVSHRGSQEDLRWPSSDTRPWSSTDSDSSGRPLGAKGGSSFETEGVLLNVAKTDRPVAVLTKSESDSKEILLPTRTVRPVMTKASSFGGISVLSRECSGGKQVTPKITKAESFNVTTLSSSHMSLSTLPPQSVTSSPSSSHLASSSSVSLQTTSPSQFPSAAAQQTFPMVAGQPTQLHLPLQQLSSQQNSGWSIGNRDSSTLGAEYPGHGASVGQQSLMWPVSSAPDFIFPGGVVLSHQTGAPYVNVDNVLYRYKLPSNTSGQTIMLAPFPPASLSLPPNQVPIASHVSPNSVISPSQHQPPSLPVQSSMSLPVQPPPLSVQPPQPPLSVQPPLPLVQPLTPISVQPPPQQQLTQQTPQQTAMQIPPPQPPTVLYVPYIQSQIQTAVAPQVSVGGSTPNMQTLQQSSQQQQPLSHHQGTHHVLADQRTYALNPTAASIDEMAAQMHSLSFLSTQLQSQQQQPSQQPQDLSSNVRPPNLVNVEPSSPPHNYILSSFKSQGYVSPQGTLPQVPMYYMQQVPGTSVNHPVRYVFSGGSPAAQHGVTPAQGSSGGIPGQVMADAQNHAPAQASSQVTGPQYLPGYPVLALPQTGDTSTPSTFVSYTLASQTTAITTTTSVLVPSSPMSMPIYPYGNLLISNQTPFTTPSTTQPPSQPPTYVQTPVAIQANSTALPVYVLTTTATQTPAAPAQIASVTSPFASFRSQSLPSAPSSGSTAILNTQLQTVGSSATGAIGYIYTPQQLTCNVSQPPHTSPVTVSGLGASSAHSSQTVSSQIPPTILTTFQVLRPNLSLVGSLRTETPPPTQQTFLSQFASPPPSSTNKVPPLSFPLVKQASDPGVDCYGLGSGSRLDQSKCGRGSQIQAVTSAPCGPTANLVYRRNVPLGDYCIFGHAIQHFNPMVFPGQRPIARFMHPTSTSNTSSNRPPKNRNKRNKSNQSSGSCNGNRPGISTTMFQPSHELTTTGHVLEIEGLPDGMKRSEVERYLEQVTCHGAKIQYLDAESGAIIVIGDNSTDFVVMGARHTVIAIFESDTAAQSALLGIKTPKFQLRPLRRSVRDVAQKKYS